MSSYQLKANDSLPGRKNGQEDMARLSGMNLESNNSPEYAVNNDPTMEKPIPNIKRVDPLQAWRAQKFIEDFHNKRNNPQIWRNKVYIPIVKKEEKKKVTPKNWFERRPAGISYPKYDMLPQSRYLNPRDTFDSYPRSQRIPTNPVSVTKVKKIPNYLKPTAASQSFETGITKKEYKPKPKPKNFALVEKPSAKDSLESVLSFKPAWSKNTIEEWFRSRLDTPISKPESSQKYIDEKNPCGIPKKFKQTGAPKKPRRKKFTSILEMFPEKQYPDPMISRRSIQIKMEEKAQMQDEDCKRQLNMFQGMQPVRPRELAMNFRKWQEQKEERKRRQKEERRHKCIVQMTKEYVQIMVTNGVKQEIQDYFNDSGISELIVETMEAYQKGTKQGIQGMKIMCETLQKIGIDATAFKEYRFTKLCDSGEEIKSVKSENFRSESVPIPLPPKTLKNKHEYEVKEKPPHPEQVETEILPEEVISPVKSDDMQKKLEPQNLPSKLPKLPINPQNIPSDPSNIPSELPKIPSEPPKIPCEPPKIPCEPPRLPSEPPRLPSEPPRLPSEPPKLPSEPPRLPNEPPRLPSEPRRLRSKPQRLLSEPLKLPTSFRFEIVENWLQFNDFENKGIDESPSLESILKNHSEENFPISTEEIGDPGAGAPSISMTSRTSRYLDLGSEASLSKQVDQTNPNRT